MKLTAEMIISGKSRNGGWNKKQFSILGIAWPPQKGWIAELEGKEISEYDLKLFLECKRHFTESGRKHPTSA